MLSSQVRPIDEHRFPRLGAEEKRLRFLLRYAERASSTHNTRPWIFKIRGSGVDVMMDLDRWLRVSDADQRELRETVGCAVENLVIAADHFGYQADVTYLKGGARVQFRPGGGHGLDPDLFRAIPLRHTCRTPFDGRPVPEEHLEVLKESSMFVDVRIDFTDDPRLLRRVQRLTVSGVLRLFADPAWRKETARWFGQGALTPARPMAAIRKVIVTRFNLAKSTARGDARLMKSAPIIGMLSLRERSVEAEVRAGRVLERLWLKATSLGLDFQPVSQLMQTPETRARTSGLFAPLPWQPLQPFRLGYPAAPAPPKKQPVYFHESRDS